MYSYKSTLVLSQWKANVWLGELGRSTHHASSASGPSRSPLRLLSLLLLQRPRGAPGPVQQPPLVGFYNVHHADAWYHTFGSAEFKFS